jgi:hypothetical protein
MASRLVLRKIFHKPSIKIMYTGFLHLHSTLRWVIFGLIIYLLIRGFQNRAAGKFTEKDRKAALFLLISSHITLVCGIFQWFTGTWGLKMLDQMTMHDAMTSRLHRFFLIEHPVGMLIAITLITVGFGRSKRAIGDSNKWNVLYWPLFFAFVVLLITIPWPFRAVGAGRGWLPGM